MQREDGQRAEVVSVQWFDGAEPLQNKKSAWVRK